MNKSTNVFAVCVLVIVVVSSALVYTTFGSGTLVVKMKDPPGWGPATAVYITFTDIMIHRANAGDKSGWVSTGVSYVNLSLAETVNVSNVIGEQTLQAGMYNIVRFNITQAIVTVDGINYTCTVESGELHVPITTGGVRIYFGQTSFLEIDVTTIVTGINDDYKLTPAAKATPVAS